MKNNKGLLFMGLLITLLITVLSFILFIKAGVSFLGWLIMILLLLLLGFIIYKTHAKGIKFIGILSGVAVVSIFVVFIFTGGFSGSGKSSVVSDGVDKKDLGNIMSGQYYFDDGNTVYYSNFDDSFKAHIYEMDEKTGANKPIFDGFGWSLVPYKGYLYFSGNTGDSIDGTYRLFKLDLKDYTYEIINEDYCYNMSMYDGWLYFINRSSSGTYSYKRLNLKDNSMETIVEDGRNANVVVYNKKLYYFDAYGSIVMAELDGTNPEIVIGNECSRFIIGDGKLIFVQDGTIKTADPDGQNIEVVRETDGTEIYTLNSSGNTIFFSEYKSDEFDYAMSGYPYTVRSIKFNGRNEKLVYEGISYGVYINVIDNDVYALDYIMDSGAGHPYLLTIVSIVDQNGDNRRLLPN
ncbi:MAG: DUF5050 domain-containing protein [Clostridia bacterium]|nr:DUF5050 domain-containing protein [Clostridia bacterium]